MNLARDLFDPGGLDSRDLLLAQRLADDIEPRGQRA